MSGTVSFRDPSGYLSVTKDRVIRTVLAGGVDNLNACVNSPVAQRLVEAGALIETFPFQADAGSTQNEVVVEHPRIPFVSYPNEWPAVMLHAAGKLTLDISSALLEEGRGLKDATPANVLFRGTRPVFIDVLSFEVRDPFDPIWIADAQFARTFLIPLLLYRRTGCPVHETFLLHRDGLGPLQAVQRFPKIRRWFPPDLGLVTLPARADRFEGQRLYRTHKTSDEGQAKFILGHHFRGLKKKLDGLAPQAVPSIWSDYETSCPSYSKEQQTIKREFVQRVLHDIRPSRVLDVGSNTGEFSLMAAAAGASVVSIDSDPESVADLWRSADKAGADVLPLVVDFARSTPATGWRGSEHAAFLDRAEDFFDCVLFLAVTHHLIVTDRLPLVQIFDALANITTRWLIIEYVGPEDAMFRALARGRDALYEWFNRSAFDETARRSFDIVECLEIPSSHRAVYLLRRKA